MQLALFSAPGEKFDSRGRGRPASHRRLMGGVLATRMLEAYPELEGLFNEELDRLLTRPADRALFGLRVPFQLVLPFQLEFRWPEDVRVEAAE